MSEKERVVIVCHPLTMGGTETTVIWLAGALCSEFEVEIITIGSKDAVPYKPIDKRVKTSHVQASGGIIGTIHTTGVLRKLLKKRAQSSVISFLTVPSIMVAIAKLGLGIRQVACERTHPRFTPIPTHWKYLRVIAYFLSVERFVFQTNEISNQFGYIDCRRRHVIPNALTSLSSADLPGRTEFFTQTQFRLIFAGRLERQKGIDILINALRIIKGRQPESDIRLVVAGMGSEKSNLVDMAKEYGLDDSIDFIGISSNVAWEIEQSHCLVLPSRWEGLPDVLMDAFAAGRPIIASEVASAGHVVDGKNGLVLNTLNAKTLALGIELLYGDRKLLQEVARGSKETSKHFEASTIAKMWVEVIRQAPQGGTNSC